MRENFCVLLQEGNGSGGCEGPGMFLDSPAGMDDPYTDFDRFRREEPIYFHEPLGQWFVFRHADVQHALGMAELSNDRMAAFAAAAPPAWRERLAPAFDVFGRWLFMKDGDEHVALRKWMQGALSPELLRSQAGAVDACSSELLEGFGPRFDLARDFAFVMPLNVLAHLIGFPREKWADAMRWSVDITDFFNILPSADDTCARILRSGQEFQEYTAWLIEERRRDPQDDLLSKFIQNPRVDPMTMVANAMVLLLAGHVAVRNLVGNTVWLLLTHPSALARVRSDPSLLPSVVEESLRFESPVSMIARVAARDFVLGSASVRQGQFVQLVLASANRDPDRFPSPEVFDVTRHPNPHLSFAPGLHTCLGAALARQETVSAVRQILERYPRLRLDPDREIVWYRNAGNRGPESLPVRVD